jgi:hypothetical protein
MALAPRPGSVFGVKIPGICDKLLWSIDRCAPLLFLAASKYCVYCMLSVSSQLPNFGIRGFSCRVTQIISLLLFIANQVWKIGVTKDKFSQYY